MIEKDPFGHPLLTYVWVIVLAGVGGTVKYLNSSDLKVMVLIRDVITAGFVGLLTFWLCEWTNIEGPLAAVLIATSGFMGTRLLKELESFYYSRFGIKPKADDSES